MSRNPCNVRFEAWQGLIWWLCPCGAESRRGWSPDRDSDAERAAAAHARRRREVVAS